MRIKLENIWKVPMKIGVSCSCNKDQMLEMLKELEERDKGMMKQRELGGRDKIV